MEAYTEAQMLIRKPVRDVFEAMIDPQRTTQFWFTKSSGQLQAGQTVTWHWEMYGVSAEVFVVAITDNQSIVFDWGQPKRRVVFSYEPLTDDTTYVTVRETGYTETGDDLLAAVRDSTGGFTTVLDGMKCFLEHGISLNLVADKFAKGE
ncbi:SRPBCC family protein [Flavobacterium caeni]|uniref:Uncharacterized conserved protein YndB, AHSA1/START domain n=1 Tax=Flavobacterium caeni TaxID=490189 RepID=A0A1G5HNY9_9FLAO|nr:SRPBCC family protein [Flavobacterium caeni]SCY65582.1 Uncharacterized conserved protein YndB, AHSA1/START domain [Flavobacterium caeni]